MDLSYGIVCRRIKHKKRVLFAFLHFYDVRPFARTHLTAECNGASWCEPSNSGARQKDAETCRKSSHPLTSFIAQPMRNSRI